MNQIPSGSTEAADISAERRHRQGAALFAVMLGALLSVALLLHRVTWWPVPVALGLAHATIVLGLVAWVRYLTAGDAHVHGRPADAAHAANPDGPEAIGALVRRPVAYDWMVRLLLLGGEGRLRRRIVDLAGVRPGDAVLDVGCGTGTLLLMAADRVGAAGTLAGVEPSPEMLERARAKARARHLNLALFEAPADALPFEDGAFDVVFGTMVMHHLPPDARPRALAEMRRVLRPGGRLVVADMEASALARFSPVALLHGLGSAAGLSQVAATVRALEQQDYENVTVHRTGTVAVQAVVAVAGGRG